MIEIPWIFVLNALPQCIEAATRGVLWKKVFLEISQNSQENTFARVSFLITLQAKTSLDDCFWMYLVSWVANCKLLFLTAVNKYEKLWK